MKRILSTLIILFFTTSSVYAAKIPDNVKSIIKSSYAKTDFRFDGLITLPDGTLYLPLYPALVKKVDSLEIKNTVPASKGIIDKPDIVVFNNDFTLLKVITDQSGRKTVLNMKDPLIEVRTGLLPQDMLVPSGLIIPDSIKGIIGNLQIPTAVDVGLKVAPERFLERRTVKTSQTDKNLVSKVAQLQDKTLYIATCYSKNIQVVAAEASKPLYALAQNSIPISIESTPDEKFILSTCFGKTFVNVISLADERVIRQIDLTTNAEEIVIDKAKNIAYVSSPEESAIYVIDLSTMTLKQKIKVKGMCAKLSISYDGKKLFYTDKKNNNVWVIEIDNDFIMKNVGSFPNVSKIIYSNGKIYLTSRTKNRVAIIDYAMLSLIKEIDVDLKPIDMISYKDRIFVLSAQNNVIQVINAIDDELTDKIYLKTNGFSTKIYQIKNTNIALIMDTKMDKYSVIDLDKKLVIKTNNLEIPVSDIVIVPTVKKINK